VLLGLLSFSPAAGASHVQCGDVITQDTKLDGDVVCEDTDGGEVSGLVIGADDVTLNLGGHTLRYPDSGDETYAVTDDGTPRNRIRMVNGTIEGFRLSVDLDASNSVVRGINIRTPFGVRLRGDHNTVRHIVADTGYAAIDLSGDGNRAVHNEVLSYEGEGIVAQGIGIRIAHNFIRAEPMGIMPGILVSGFADAAVIGNDVSTRSSSGIELRNGAGALVARNFAHDNGISGIVIRRDASNVTLRRNMANDNGEYGIDAPGAIDGRGNRASGNGNPAQCVGVRCR
jgi:parallel beta-helix repeat protein